MAVLAATSAAVRHSKVAKPRPGRHNARLAGGEARRACRLSFGAHEQKVREREAVGASSRSWASSAVVDIAGVVEAVVGC